MLRLKKPYTYRIPNRMAAYAAILLVVTSLAGAGNQAMTPVAGDAPTTAATKTVEPAQATLATGHSARAKKTKRFKVSFFLFPNH